MKTTIYIGMSLDGYIAKEDGSLEKVLTFHAFLKAIANGSSSILLKFSFINPRNDRKWMDFGPSFFYLILLKNQERSES